MRDVGYSGLKDRHAETTQWFSVPRWHSPDWSTLAVQGVEILDLRRHHRKLRRGAHKANMFRIVLRGDDLERHADALGKRLDLIRQRGVPNYFGEQRFGRDGGNVKLAQAWASGKRLPGDKANLDGTGSVFDVSKVDDTLQSRLAAMDIHPAGILAGEGSGLGSESWQAALDKARVEEGWRSFRLVVRDLDWSPGSDAVTVSFSLGRGAFATSVLREICDT